MRYKSIPRKEILIAGALMLGLMTGCGTASSSTGTATTASSVTESSGNSTSSGPGVSEITTGVTEASTEASSDGSNASWSSGNEDITDLGNEQLNQLCDGLLASLVSPDKTPRDNAYNIYYWVENNITYHGSCDTSDWVKGAIEALSTYKGDCYAYATASYALLRRAGFDTILVHEDDLSHFWVMVKVDGVWRHFDATTGWGTERFLWTTEELLSYSYYNDSLGFTISYHWNPANGPATE